MKAFVMLAAVLSQKTEAGIREVFSSVYSFVRQSFTRLEKEEAMKYAARFWYGALFIGLTLVFLLFGTAQAYDTHSGTINSETWGAGTHYVSASVSVSDDQTLTISPGAVVKFAPNTQLQVNGTLSAQGTSWDAGNYVVFTSKDDNGYGEPITGSDGSPSAGDWYGIYLYGVSGNDGIGEFDYCRLRYGGHTSGSADANVYFNQSNSGHFTHSISEYSAQQGVRVATCSPTLTSSIFASNTNHGIHVSGSTAAPTITGNTFTSNGQYGAYLSSITLTSYSGNQGTGNTTNGFGLSGTVGADRIWSVGSSTFPFVLTGTVTVNAGYTLELSEDTIVKGASTGQLTVNGTLDVNGAEGDSVIFTSLKDDEYGGDTDGDQGDPSAGDWYGIYLYGVSGNDGIGEFDWCRIRYGGHVNGSADANVYFNQSDSGHFTNSISEHSAQQGVKINTCSPTLTSSTFSNNTNHGIYAAGGTAAPTITGNTFTDNTQYGAYLSGITLTSYSGNTGSGNGTNGFGVSGTVGTHQTWSVGSSTFPFVLIGGNVQVNISVTLTLSAGTIIKGNTTGQMYVLGTLDVNGASGNRVTFTSLKDDNYGGNTDGDQGDPAVGDWYGIYLYGVSGNEGIGEFDYCRLRYGGHVNGSADANVYFYSSDSGYFTQCISEYSAQQGVRVRGCSPTITSSTFADNNADGIYCYDTSSDPSISDCTIQNNGSYAIRTYADNVKDITGTMTITGNTPNAIWVGAETVYNGTWLNHSVPYIVGGNVTVDDGDVLTIRPGNTLKFAGNHQLYVPGKLIAQGTSGSHITFTSNQTGTGHPAKGDWQYIYFNGADSGCLLDYCDIRYGGSVLNNGEVYIRNSGSNVTVSNCTIEQSKYAGIYVYGSSPSISDCIIQNNDTYGIYCSNTSADPSISDCTIQNNGSYAIRTYADNVKAITGAMTFTGNTPDAIWVGGESMNTATWLNHSVPYIIGSSITVNNLQTLTIAPGNTLKFNGNHQLYVPGKLIAQGTSGSHITFTSNQSPQNKGDWQYIYFNGADSGCLLDYCDISYGGSVLNTGSVNIYNSGSNVTVSNCTIEQSKYAGIYVSGSSPGFSDCTIRNNDTYGVYCYNASSDPTISSCTIEDNGDYAIRTYGDNVKDITGTMTITGNTNNAIWVGADGNITTGTWLNHGVPYDIGGSITVSDTPTQTLTIAAGNTLRFTGNYQLRIDGALSAVGTDDDPAGHITFTRHPGYAGYWQYLWFYNPDAACNLTYCDISYGGSSTGEVYIHNSGGNVTISNCTVEESGTAGIYVDNSSPSISDCTIQDNTTYGVQCSNTSADPSISTCTIEDNGDYAIRTYADHVKDITGTMTITGNTNNAIWVGADNLTTGTWLNHGIPYDVGGNSTVSDAQTLTIAAGNTLRFMGNYQLRIDGALSAVGTDADHITFTRHPGYAGYWQYLWFYNPDAACNLTYCDISYGGSSTGEVYIHNSGGNVTISNCTVEESGTAGIYVDNSSPSISDCTIQDNTTYGVQCSNTSADPSISGCTIEDNGDYAIRTYANNVKDITGTMTITGNTNNAIWVGGETSVTTGTWLNHGVPYDIGYTHVTVSDAQTLTINAGNTLRFTGNYQLRIDGALSAVGTDDDPAGHITFTRHPAYAGYWQYLWFYNPDAACNLTYCDLSYGGSSTGMVYAYGAGTNLSLSDCVIKYSNTAGIYLTNGSSPSFEYCVITGNGGDGIRINGANIPTFGGSSEWNDIYNNTTYDLYNGTSNIQAEYVYWGVPDAEIEARIYHKPDSGTLGTVDFDPWLGSGHYVSPSEHSGLITSNETWYYADSPHHVTGTVTINSGVTVTIEDGCEVQFDAGTSIDVNGTLTADGASGITFTRSGDGVEWVGLRFLSGSSGTLDYCTIQYATHSTGAGVYTASSSPTVTNCTIQDCDYGLYGDDALPGTFSGNTIQYNTTGVYLTGGSSPSLSVANTILNNTTAGVHFNACTGTIGISNQTITGSTGTYGAIYMQGCHEFTIGTGNSISSNSWPLTIDVGSYASSGSSIPTSGNTKDAIQVYGGSTGSDFVWRDFSIPYIVTLTPTIASGDKLTIEQDVTVQFENTKYMQVVGTLWATGASGHLVTFTRNDEADEWGGLKFQSGSSGDLDYCTIEYGTYGTGYGVYADAPTSLSLDHCAVQNNDTGIYFQNAADPNANVGTGNTISGNTNCGVHYKNCSSLGTIAGLTLQNNGNYGAFRFENSGDFTLGSNTIGGTGTENNWPLTIDAGSFPGSGSTLPTTDNTNNAIRVTSGSSTKSGTWNKFGIDYIVTEHPTIASGNTLTIAEGNTIKFNSGRGIIVAGTLTAEGSSGNEITFTRSGAESWDDLQFNAGSEGTLDHCIIEHAIRGIYGYSDFPGTITNCTIRNNSKGIYATGTSPNLSGSGNSIESNSIGVHFYNCTSANISNQSITNNTGACGAIYMQGCGTFTLGTNTISGNSWPLTIDIGSYPDPDNGSLGNIPTSGNTNDDVQIYGGTTTGSFTWKNLADPLDYIVINTPTISNGGSLTIENNVNIRFENGRYIDIYGTLNAQGASGGILFTRWEETDQWYGLWFRSGSSGDLDYCTIEYVTYGTGYGVHASSPNSLSLDNCTLQNNDYGFYGTPASPSFVNCQIINNNTYGIYLNGVCSPTFGSDLAQWNDVYGNGTGDEKALRNGSENIAARYIYWGTEVESEIQGKIWDKSDDEALGTVSYAPWANAAHDVALAVELSSLTAQAGDGEVTLRWVTESEVGNLGFHVYRALSEDGEYERLTAELIKGAGSTSERQAYRFADGRLKNGVTYWYKLEDVAFDGTTTLHGPIGVMPQAKEKMLTAGVELSSFTAQAGDGEVTLHWVTERETDNLGFSVYRALEEEGVYERLTTERIAGAGTSTERREYAFTDSRLPPGITYWYMLEYVSSNGTWSKHGPVSVTLQGEAVVLPASFGLYQNAPNPFNPATVIRYDVPEACVVQLTVYDVLGREVDVLVDGETRAGYHTAVWEAQEVGSGVYLVRMEAGDFVEVRKMVVMR